MRKYFRHPEFFAPPGYVPHRHTSKIRGTVEMKSKENLRKVLLAKRACLTPTEIEEKSSAIIRKVFNLDMIKNGNLLLTYCGKGDEVNTLPLIDTALLMRKKVMVPLTRGHGQLEWSQINDLNHLVRGPLGIPEPAEETVILQNPPMDAPIIVPCLGFTTKGDRLGFGGGYFDRYLAQHSGIKIGLAFELQHIDHLPVESHDVQLDLVITEIGQYP